MRLPPILRTAVATTACLLLLLGISSADDSLAKPTDAIAREHISKGNKLYQLGEFAQAVEEYKAGALAQDAPVFYFNLGQCYRQLGAYKEAIWQYERFLARGKPTGKVKEAVEAFLVQMKSELEQKAKTQPPLEAAPESLPSQPVQSVVQATAIERGPPWYKDNWGWGLTASGVVAGGLSGLLFWSGVNLDNDANEEPDRARQDELHDRADTRRIFGVVAGIGGAALIATGVIKLAITSVDRPTQAAWHLGISHKGVTVLGRF